MLTLGCLETTDFTEENLIQLDLDEITLARLSDGAPSWRTQPHSHQDDQWPLEIPESWLE